MSRQMKWGKVFPEANRKLRHVSINALVLAIALLAAACGRSTESLPQPTATPATSPVDTEPALSPAGEPPDQYIKFGHLTTEDGLSNSTAWDVMKDSRGYIWIATFDGLNCTSTGKDGSNESKPGVLPHFLIYSLSK